MFAPITSDKTEASARETPYQPPQIHVMSGSRPSIAELDALIGNLARANILSVLLDGRALTATELAYIGRV
jgi:hypothetical protein